MMDAAAIAEQQAQAPVREETLKQVKEEKRKRDRDRDREARRSERQKCTQ